MPSLERMVTIDRAESMACQLFPDEYHDGSDCKNEKGREGQPCNICASSREQWLNRVQQVRDAMIKAFS